MPSPAHTAISGPLSYACERPLAPGTLVRVPLGRSEVLGVVWSCAAQPPANVPAASLRSITADLSGLAPLSAAWRQLVEFTARYYQRGLGEVAVAALPPALRSLDAEQLQRRLRRRAAAAAAHDTTAASPRRGAADSEPPPLSAQQQAALAQIDAEPGPFLLFGATGSGKTEVYLRSAQALLERDASAQALILVPEINLTPQLEARFSARFAPRWGDDAVVSLHSAMTPAQRLRAWLLAHEGRARIVLGTRLAVFASLPRLGLIVVDEEHDPSYRQQEGARYSARDLALYRGRLEQAKVILGSATPSIESWYHSRPGGRYRRIDMPERIGAAPQAQVRRIDMSHQPRGAVLSPPLVEAIAERVRRGEQSLLLLNRRGYAPVLHCPDCGWKSDCPHCSAHQVFHKIDRTLRCHHCGFTQRVPRACPSCGNLDIAALGRGTERLEEHLAERLADVRRPDGQPPRILRIDADSTRAQGALEAALDQVHAGQIDVLVGTQMVAKGHDFRRITLVAAVNPDGALFSSDFRAAERLFALLVQAAGRAGRAGESGPLGQPAPSEMWVQTFHPAHPLFEALRRYDYPAFAESELAERQAAQLPPFGHQALLRAEARSQEAAQAFLTAAAARAQAEIPEYAAGVTLYGAVPQTIARVARVERAQLLVESASRRALQAFLAAWRPWLLELRAQPEHRAVIRWAIDVDPPSI